MLYSSCSIPAVITIHVKLISEDTELGHSSVLVFQVFYSPFSVHVPRFLFPILSFRNFIVLIFLRKLHLLTLVYRDDVGR
jgi:hypothetical protein